MTERDLPTQETNFEIIGTGEIGSKAKELVEKTPYLLSIGFKVPKRTILAEGFFDSFFQRNNLGHSLRDASKTVDIIEKIKNCELANDQLETLQKVEESYSNKPLVVRSSAVGDARGTGTYSSTFCENEPNEVAKAVKKVLASYFSESAKAFRRDAKTGEGMGIIIEPIIGQQQMREYENEPIIAPILSGMGYSSTARGEGYISIVPGIGCSVDSKYGERITKSALEPYRGLLMSYVDSEQQAIIYGYKQQRYSALLKTEGRRFTFHDYHVNAYCSLQYRGNHIIKTEVEFSDEISSTLQMLDINPLFDRMTQIESTFGKPQYFEWAMTIDKGEPTFWIIQIANVDKNLDAVDFQDYGETLFTGHTVTGTGCVEVNKIFHCRNYMDNNALREFNRNNKNYALLYSGSLVSGATPSRYQISYEDYNNASVFLEIQDTQHVHNPIEHFSGQLDVTNKLFGVVDYDAEVPPNWELFETRVDHKSDRKIYNGKFKVLASERQNRIIVFDTESKD